MRVTMAVVLTAAFAISGAAQDAATQTGAPADVFPRPDRPVADIISPIWHDETNATKPANRSSLFVSWVSDPE